MLRTQLGRQAQYIPSSQFFTWVQTRIPRPLREHWQRPRWEWQWLRAAAPVGSHAPRFRRLTLRFELTIKRVVTAEQPFRSPLTTKVWSTAEDLAPPDTPRRRSSIDR